MKKLYSYMVAISLFALPLVAKAQVTLTNPLGTTDVRIIVARVIQGALSVSGVVALIMFLYGGMLWLTSTGQEARITKGKKTLVWATLGIVVIASAYMLTLLVFRVILEGRVSP